MPSEPTEEAVKPVVPSFATHECSHGQRTFRIVPKGATDGEYYHTVDNVRCYGYQFPIRSEASDAK